MTDDTTVRLTGKELAEMLRVTPSAISRAVTNDTLIRDIAPVAMWADVDPENDRVRGFDVPADDAEMMRQMALSGQFAGSAGIIPRSTPPPARSTPRQFEWDDAAGRGGFDAGAGHIPGSMTQALPYFPPPSPSRSDADIERVVSLLQQQIEAREAENDRIRQILVRTEQEASTARSEHLRALDELRERYARAREEQAEAAAKLREDLAQARLDVRAYEAGREPVGDEEDENEGSSWQALVMEYAPVILPAAAGMMASFGARMQAGGQPPQEGGSQAPPSHAMNQAPDGPTSTPQPSERQIPPSESPQLAQTVAGWIMESALSPNGEGFGPYLDQLTPALKQDDWKAIVGPLLADLETRDHTLLAQNVTPALLERWSVMASMDPEGAVQLATAMGFVSTTAEQETLRSFSTALFIEGERLSGKKKPKTPLHKPKPAPADAPAN